MISADTLIKPIPYAKAKLKLFLLIPSERRTQTQIDEMIELIETLVLILISASL